MELNSQRVRALAPENDPLKIGMGWKVEDLDKPQIMVESTFGDSHPGSAHLDQFVNEAMRGIADAGGKGARYFTTDICDGIAQGHDGINYSLAHRDMIANMIEIHGNSTGFDGGVFIASCDKSVPACLMGLPIQPCAREVRLPKKSLPIISTMPVHPAEPVPSWVLPPPCRSWPKLWG